MFREGKTGALSFVKGGYALPQIPASRVSSVSCLTCSAHEYLLTFLHSSGPLTLCFPTPLSLPFDFFFFRMNEGILSYWSKRHIFFFFFFFLSSPPVARQGKEVVLGRKVGSE